MPNALRVGVPAGYIYKYLNWFFFVNIFAQKDTYRTEFVISELEIRTKTFVDWSMFCREVCIDYVYEHSEKLGGGGVWKNN